MCASWWSTHAGRAVGQRPRERDTARGAAVAVEPFSGPGDVDQRGSILAVDVELGPIGDDQPLVRADHRRRREHREGERAGRRARVGEREVGARDQRALAGGGRDAVGREDLRAQHLRGGIAHAARRAVGQHVADGFVPGVVGSGVVDIDGEDVRLSDRHRRRARLRDLEHRRYQLEFGVQVRGVYRASFSRDELGHRIAVGVEEAQPQRVGLSADGERRGSGCVDERHTVGAPFAGRCRIGTGHLVVRRLLVGEREGEGQRTGRDAIHLEVEDEVELNRSQGRIGDREVPVRERRNRKLRRVRDRNGDVIAALRTGGRAPADARGRYPVRDDGVTRLNFRGRCPLGRASLRPRR